MALRFPKALLTLVWNLGGIALVVLPVCLTLVWVQAVITRVPGMLELSYAVETGGFYYLLYLPGYLLGGAIHQLVLALSIRRYPTKARTLSWLLSPLIPLGVLVLGERLDLLASFALPVTISLVPFSALSRAPRPLNNGAGNLGSREGRTPKG